MLMHYRRCFVCGLLCMTLGGALFAQETMPAAPTPPGAEDPYLDLRRSTDRTTQRFAERYFNLVKLQEWSSASGKSKINAKYLGHTPDLRRVTLAAVRGSGKNRVVRQITVEVDQLSKTCQSRVRQIAALQAKLDELAATADKSTLTGEEDGGFLPAEDRGAPMADERGAEPDSPRVDYSIDASRDARETASRRRVPPRPQSSAVIESDDPDPLGFGELPNVSAASPMATGLFPTPLDSPAPISAPGGPVDRSQWANDYAAFHANFTASRDDRGEGDWGELRTLAQMNEIVNAATHAEGGLETSRRQVAELARELGEVHWEGGLAGVTVHETGEQEVEFDLPAPPEPLKVRFVVDRQESPRNWTDLQPGERVSFTGRLDIERPNEIIVRIRKADAGASSANDAPRR